MITVIQHDPQYPGLESGAMLKFCKIGKSSYICFLHQVFRVMMTIAVTSGSFIEVRIIATHQYLIQRSLAFDDLIDHFNSYYDYIYFIFPHTVTHATKIIWKDKNDKMIKIIPNVIIFGKDVEKNKRYFEY